MLLPALHIQPPDPRVVEGQVVWSSGHETFIWTDQQTIRRVGMDLEIFLMTDQPECCRHCGARTNVLAGIAGNRQVVECPDCHQVYRLEED